MSKIDLDRAGSLRPQLEDLTAEQIQRLASEALAEARRRSVFLDENNASAAADLVRSLRERDPKLHVTAREYDYQHAEAMSVAWAERAEALMREKPEVPPVPVDLGRVLDDVLDAAARPEVATSSLPWPLAHAINAAFKVRARPWPAYPGPAAQFFGVDRGPVFSAAPSAYRAWADDPDFDTRDE